MKIFALLNSLNSEEKKALKKQFYCPNEQLMALFNEIVSISEDEFHDKKPLIYRRVFNKKWTEVNDKYLRTQLTELLNRLRAFIAQDWIDKEDCLFEINKYINYLQQLSSRQQTDLFEKEWSYYLQLFEENQNYYGLSKLYIVRYNMLIKNPKLITEAIKIIQLAYRYSIMANKEDDSVIRYTAYTLNYAKDIYGIEKTMEDEDFETIEEEVKRNFFNPVMIANQLILEKDENSKWEFTNKICSILSNPDYSLKGSNKFKITQSIFNYAVILIYEEKLEKAKTILEFILKYDLIKSAVFNSTVFYFNYSSLLLKLGDKPNALKYHSLVIENMHNVPPTRKTQFIIRDIYLNLLNKNYKDTYLKISEVTPNLFKEDQLLYVRALLIMYLIDTEDIEAAYRECENARRLPYYESELAQEEAENIEFIYKLLSIQVKENLNRAKFERIIENVYESELWIKSSHLLKMWLKEYIDKLNKSI